MLLHNNKTKKEQAILVNVELSRGENNDLDELKELVLCANVEPIDIFTVKRDNADPRYYIGSGKVQEIAECAKQSEDIVVVFNNSLAPTQQRNIEKITKCRVLDRTEVILDIFAQRARTYEGKLQVELAQLQHLSTRLVRGWTHLERQKGGIGLRGPGETQLETDRRLLRNRIGVIKERLVKVRKQRNQNRRSRQRSMVKTIALVGYTNVGKSSLFNRLCNESIYAENQLFATLDPTMRRLSLPQFGKIVLADTVGFIRGLPHALIDAFQATLEELTKADMLLHVVDAHHPDRDLQIQQVQQVLAEIGASNVPQLLVYNKIDLIDGYDMQARIDDNVDNKPQRAWISVAKNIGIELLQQAIKEVISDDVVHCCLTLMPAEARLRAKLYQLNAIVDETIGERGEFCLEIKLSGAKFDGMYHNVNRAAVARDKNGE